jgi:hypothetical protein
MDIAFLLVDISSTNPLFSTIANMVSSIINPLIKNNYDIRLALIKLRSDNHSAMPIIHHFTRSAINFKHWLITDHAPVDRHIRNETIAICKNDIVSLL